MSDRIFFGFQATPAEAAQLDWLQRALGNVGVSEALRYALDTLFVAANNDWTAADFANLLDFLRKEGEDDK